MSSQDITSSAVIIAIGTRLATPVAPEVDRQAAGVLARENPLHVQRGTAPGR